MKRVARRAWARTLRQLIRRAFARPNGPRVLCVDALLTCAPWLAAWR